MKKNRYNSFNLITITCFMMMLADSCNLADHFPSRVSDIDTLAVYKKYLDSIQRETAPSPPQVPLEIAPDTEQSASVTDTLQKPVQQVSTAEQWTICLGTFKIKENAEHKIQEIKQLPDIHLITRNNLYYVTIGLKESREASVLQKQALSLPQDGYIMKLKTTDIMLPVLLK